MRVKDCRTSITRQITVSCCTSVDGGRNVNGGALDSQSGARTLSNQCAADTAFLELYGKGRGTGGHGRNISHIPVIVICEGNRRGARAARPVNVIVICAVNKCPKVCNRISSLPSGQGIRVQGYGDSRNCVLRNGYRTFTLYARTISRSSGDRCSSFASSCYLTIINSGYSRISSRPSDSFICCIRGCDSGSKSKLLTDNKCLGSWSQGDASNRLCGRFSDSYLASCGNRTTASGSSTSCSSNSYGRSSSSVAGYFTVLINRNRTTITAVPGNGLVGSISGSPGCYRQSFALAFFKGKRSFV